MLTNLYVLAPERSEAMVARFLDRFLPDREHPPTEYLIDYRYPTAFFDGPDDVIRYCVVCRFHAEQVYWNRVGHGEPNRAHVHFLRDGGLILGLSVADATETPGWLDQLKAFAGNGPGFCGTWNPSSVREFEYLAKSPAERENDRQRETSLQPTSESDLLTRETTVFTGIGSCDLGHVVSDPDDLFEKRRKRMMRREKSRRLAESTPDPTFDFGESRFASLVPHDLNLLTIKDRIGWVLAFLGILAAIVVIVVFIS